MPADVVESQEAQQRLKEFTDRVRTIRRSLHEVVVGQDEMIDELLMCALTGSHALLVGVPGLAKTLMVKALAAAFHWKFSRIQFTPDLMPADMTGYELLDRSEDTHGPKMVFRPGPVFANLVLADEINRAAAQDAVGPAGGDGRTARDRGRPDLPLEEPFLVAATQNPIEQEGTYPLPEAQLDRFMMEIRIDYPSPAQEEEIVMRTTSGDAEAAGGRVDAGGVPAAPRPGAGRARGARTWPPTRCGCAAPAGRTTPGRRSSSSDYVAWGAGPRGSQNLVLAAKARALLVGRCAPLVEDIRAVALPILRHRIIVNHRAVGDGVTSGKIVEKLLQEVAP